MAIYHEADCFRIDVVPLIGYWFNVASVVLMVVAAFDGSPTAKYVHRRLYPYDQHPPPSCVECCASRPAPTSWRLADGA